ncbi:MAG TPA: c-type cytochrome [Telluria sp.]|nr:c-type cytochrome [Telluria sp.]
MNRLFSWRNRWFAGSIGAVLALALLAALAGFLWLPAAQGPRNAGWWEAICSAAGAVLPFRAQGAPDESAVRPSNVIVSAQMMTPASEAAIGRGATLAQNCTMCHGARGMSPAGTPHLAGQPAAATYKQLRDYKSQHRRSAIMEPLVENLNDEDMRDLAAYYAFLPRIPSQGAGGTPPRLVRNGDPVRNIGACAACHAASVAKPAAPQLDGLPATYLRAQLNAFARGERRNDLQEQMRNAARQLRPDEVEELVDWYASR